MVHLVPDAKSLRGLRITWLRLDVSAQNANSPVPSGSGLVGYQRKRWNLSFTQAPPPPLLSSSQPEVALTHGHTLVFRISQTLF